MICSVPSLLERESSVSYAAMDLVGRFQDTVIYGMATVCDYGVEYAVAK